MTGIMIVAAVFGLIGVVLMVAMMLDSGDDYDDGY